MIGHRIRFSPTLVSLATFLVLLLRPRELSQLGVLKRYSVTSKILADLVTPVLRQTSQIFLTLTRDQAVGISITTHIGLQSAVTRLPREWRQCAGSLLTHTRDGSRVVVEHQLVVLRTLF